MYRSLDTFSFHLLRGSWGMNYVTRLGNRCFYPLSHFTILSSSAWHLRRAPHLISLFHKETGDGTYTMPLCEPEGLSAILGTHIKY